MITTNCEFQNKVNWNDQPPNFQQYWNWKNVVCSTTDIVVNVGAINIGEISATTTEAGTEQYAFEYKGATSTPFYYRNFWTGADVVIVMLLGFICFTIIMTILVKTFLRFNTCIYRKGQ